MLRAPLSAAVLVLSCYAASAAAQAPAADTTADAARFTLKGLVLDPMRAPVASAHVTAVSEAGTAAPETLTDERGEFTLLLPAGRYIVSVAAAGFADATERIAHASGGSETRQFVLAIAGVHESVSVTAPGGYQVQAIGSATKTATALRDVPQSITIVTKELIRDQLMMSVGDVVRYIPGVTSHQGENNRDQIIVRGNSSSADFFVNGVRDDVQYYRDLYNLDRIEALKGPNAMIFGRGGAGGVINRVTKEAQFQPFRELSLQGGEFGNRRITADVDQPLSRTVAFRVNAMYENSDSFRHGVNLARGGVNPTLAVTLGPRTTMAFGYEYLKDTRVADRGVPSFQGVPVDTMTTFYGNPDDSHVHADVNLASARVEHRAGAVLIRNSTLVGNYDRGYQNYVPGVVTADKQQVTLNAYNNATDRTNVFNQTDLIFNAATGPLRHTLLAGAEVGRQLTDNFRNTGFFNNTATSLLAPFADPTINTPVTYRQSATDADNHVGTNVAAAYAQDQVEITRYVQVVGGIRFDRFDLQYHNNRNGDTLDRLDNLVSPRAGLVVKPVRALSIYSSYSVSYLPSSGDQFSSLTTITRQAQPEKFTNDEVGVKWDVTPGLSFTTAVYRLNRTNTRSTDPNDPTRIVQTGSQRTNGYELGLNGRITGAWTVAGGYAWQDAYVTSATTAAAAGASVAQVPHHTFSLWNNYQVHPRMGAGLGVIYRADMWAAIDNTVTLPGYTRADAALYFSLSPRTRLQVNVENLMDARYFVNADSNSNISPGFPRAVRVGLTSRF
jgi:catecholate siderophore receptor